MKQPIVCAAFAALVLASPVAAEPLRLAQGALRDAVPPHEVLTIVRSTGLDPLDRPMRRGPNYVLRAVNGQGHEVRVVVGARLGDIISVTPVATALRSASPGAGPESYEALPDGYVPISPPGAYGSSPPIMLEPGPHAVYGRRPPAPIPNQGLPAGGDTRSLSGPRVITAIPPGDAGETGQLPPPPDRFQHRPLPPPGAPAATHHPAPPPKRAASAVPAKPPLPKARPAAVAPPAAAAPLAESSVAPMDADGAPLPPAIPENQSGDLSVAH